MSTRSVIGYTEGDGFIGRYCHWDGYPTHMASQLWKIVNRDGMKDALYMLCEEHFGWSSIYADKNSVLIDEGEAEKNVELGYGTAYTDPSENEWISYQGNADEDYWCTEWAYAFSITHNTMSIFHYVPGKNVWLLVTVVKVSGDEPDWNDIERIGLLMCDEYSKIG